jgi:hypothetical protein
MVHEKQIKNEESAALLNQNTAAGTLPHAVLYSYLMKRRPLEILAPIFNYFPVFTKYFYSFNPNH